MPQVQHENSDRWEPEFWEGRFACLLTCNNPRCLESVSLAGDVKMADEDLMDDLGLGAKRASASPPQMNTICI